MWNIVIGFAKELGLITEEAAIAIDKELAPQIISGNGSEAFEQVHKAMEKVAKDLKLRGTIAKAEPWLAEIRLLEKKVKTLEDKLDLIVKSQVELPRFEKRLTQVETNLASFSMATDLNKVYAEIKRVEGKLEGSKPAAKKAKTTPYKVG